MKVTNGEVWAAKEPLQALLSERWPVKTAYWLAKLARKLNEQHATVEAVRVQLIKRYGEANDQGQTVVRQDGENWAAFARAFEELMALEVEIDAEPVALPDAEGVMLTPETLMALEPFVVLA